MISNPSQRNQKEKREEILSHQVNGDGMMNILVAEGKPFLGKGVALIPIFCNAKRCNASRDRVSPKLIDEGNFDTRLSGEVCDHALRASFADRLSEIERESWEEYRYRKHQLRKEALGLRDKVAEKKSIRVVGRSEKEENEAKERHLRVVENY